MGKGQTAKFFINEQDGKVKNIKVMWNDWTKDIGNGVHIDKAIAEFMVSTLSVLYAKSLKEELLKTFRGKIGAEFKHGYLSFSYTYNQGPAIGERLIVVESD